MSPPRRWTVYYVSLLVSLDNSGVDKGDIEMKQAPRITGGGGGAMAERDVTEFPEAKGKWPAFLFGFRVGSDVIGDIVFGKSILFSPHDPGHPIGIGEDIYFGRDEREIRARIFVDRCL